jgi:hypothetical protein
MKKSRRKVVDVSIQVTCLEDDANIVKEDLRKWFCEHDVAMVFRHRTGGVKASKPRTLTRWMREVLTPEDLE